MKTIVLATANKGKFQQMAAYLKNVLPADEYEIVSMSDLGINNLPEETGKTYEENAVQKTEYVANKLSGDYIVIGNDSGIEIEYFDKAPGLYSHRWLPKLNGHQKIHYILAKMYNETNRFASMNTGMAIHIPGEKIFYYTITINGAIAQTCNNKDAYGYDSIFIPSGYLKTLDQFDTIAKPTNRSLDIAVRYITR